MRREEFDVAVVGVGPAGSTLARITAEAGLRVLLVDRRAEIGVPVQCAEYVSGLILRHVALSRGCVAQEVSAMRTHLPNGEVGVSRAPGFILNRAVFDKHLAILAARAGADVRTHATATWDGEFTLHNSLGHFPIVAKVVVGADGPRSTIGKAIGRVNTRFVAATQVEVVAGGHSDATEVYFDRRFRGGYGWYFPKGDSANVGVGLEGASGAALSEALEMFLENLQESGRLGRITRLRRCGGLVPVDGPLGPVSGNVLLVGDAAGHAHPMSGAGILNAIIAGELAGEAVVGAARAGEPSLLEGYAEGVSTVLDEPLRRACEKRERLLASWDGDDDTFCQVVKTSWYPFDRVAQYT